MFSFQLYFCFYAWNLNVGTVLNTISVASQKGRDVASAIKSFEAYASQVPIEQFSSWFILWAQDVLHQCDKPQILSVRNYELSPQRLTVETLGVQTTYSSDVNAAVQLIAQSPTLMLSVKEYKLMSSPVSKVTAASDYHKQYSNAEENEAYVSPCVERDNDLNFASSFVNSVVDMFGAW